MADLNSRGTYTTDECQCQCGCGYGAEIDDYDPEWLEFIDTRRQILGRPSVVKSSKRCKIHNDKPKKDGGAGGVPNSAHERDALDEATVGGKQRHEALLATYLTLMVAEGIMALDAAISAFAVLRDAQIGIGVASSFHHIDRDPIKVRPAAWTY